MKKILEVLSKSANGQWSLFKTIITEKEDKRLDLSKSQKLEKAVVYKQIPKGSCNCGAHSIKSEGHYDWCDGLKPKTSTGGNPNKHLQADNRVKIDGMIKKSAMIDLDKFIMSQPKGSIDFDHIHKNLKGLIPHGTMEDWFDHHTEDAKSLDDLYHDHGGIGAVEHALQRSDANGMPWMYHLDDHPNAKNKRLHHDVLDALNPGKGKNERDGEAWSEFPDDEVKRKARQDEFNPDLHKYHHPGKHQRVVDTFDDLMGGDDGYDDSKEGAHNDAAYDRALDAFKRKHSLSP